MAKPHEGETASHNWLLAHGKLSWEWIIRKPYANHCMPLALTISANIEPLIIRIVTNYPSACTGYDVSISSWAIPNR